MATMTAKYKSNCYVCANLIRPGAQIDYDRAKGGARHLGCTPYEPPADALYFRAGSGSGGRAYDAGEVLRSPAWLVERDGWPAYVTVLHVRAEYIREDGLSFGVGDDSGYIYDTYCRPATDEEAAPPLIAAREERARLDAARSRVTAITRDIQARGERPDGDNSPTGERLIDTQDIYGGGGWFVVGPEGMWHIENNGRDGDNWSANNVRTGGAGAIGYRVPFDQALADELRALAAVLGTRPVDPESALARIAAHREDGAREG